MIAFRRGESVRLMVESAIDNQRQLAKLESKENDRCSRDIWCEKSNICASLPDTIIATRGVSARGLWRLIKGSLTRCGNREI